MKFKLRVDDRMRAVSIHQLNLGTRLTNYMMRNRIETVGDLVEKYKTTASMYKMRGIGEKSVDELIIALIDLQCSFMNDKEKTAYAKEIYELNMEG